VFFATAFATRSFFMNQLKLFAIGASLNLLLAAAPVQALLM
jgi:hypothetical protein